MECKYSIKDKNNIATYNVWSCGRYSNNLTGFITRNGTEGTVTIGETGIILTRQTSNSTYFFLETNITISEEDIGKTATITCQGKGHNASISLIFYTSNWTNIFKTYVNLSDECSNIIVTEEIVENTNFIQLGFVTSSVANDQLYLNNINITIQ